MEHRAPLKLLHLFLWFASYINYRKFNKRVCLTSRGIKLTMKQCFVSRSHDAITPGFEFAAVSTAVMCGLAFTTII
jgi:hypothetical protein